MKLGKKNRRIYMTCTATSCHWYHGWECWETCSLRCEIWRSRHVPAWPCIHTNERLTTGGSSFSVQVHNLELWFWWRQKKAQRHSDISIDVSQFCANHRLRWIPSTNPSTHQSTLNTWSKLLSFHIICIKHLFDISFIEKGKKNHS